MAYNSMDSLLMGGIVPTQITAREVFVFVHTDFKRQKSFDWMGTKIKGKSWAELMAARGIGPDQQAKIITAIADFLRASSTYGLIGGPRALSLLRTARINLIELKRPAVDFAIRIMKDMRRPTTNRMATLRKRFYQEANPYEAIRLMQFAPGFNYFDKKLTALPAGLQERYDLYQTNADKALAARVRASKRRAKYPQYRDLVSFDVKGADYLVDPLARPEESDIVALRESSTDAEVLRRIEEGKRTRARNLANYFSTREGEDAEMF